MQRSALLGLIAAFVLLATSVGCRTPVPPASPEQRASVRIVLYTTAWCPACAGVRRWLAVRGIPFEDLDVENSAAAAARHRMLNPSRSVPTIDVEGRILIGFDEEELRTAVDLAAHRRSH